MLSQGVRHWLGPLAAVVVAYEANVFLPELQLRRTVFSDALRLARLSGKPLLNVGCLRPLKQWWHPCGDVCLDTDIGKAAGCRAQVFRTDSVLHIPFPDHYFGAATVFHVLEHMHSLGDLRLAIAELERVADRVFVLVPCRQGLRATFHEDHFLWLDPVPGGYLAEDRATGARAFMAMRDPQPCQVPISTTLGG